jgi:gamma-glutamyltranspeptidase / glutathione hydrolase
MGVGAVACGHPVTAAAATEVLREGGNAFDAAAAALWAACAAEPLLVSPGGGGFLLARPVDAPARVYDFFVQTPGRRLPPHEEDFREVEVDFGAARQAFHIGLGSAAVPGIVAGAFHFQRELGLMPMSRVTAPARAAAREGVEILPLQAHLARLLEPILLDTPGSRALFCPAGSLLVEGERHHQPEFADFLDALGREGPDLMYRGEVAHAVDQASRSGGGHLRLDDFNRYEVLVREPLEVEYRGHRVLTNPPPASGGLLIAFALSVLADGASRGADAAADALRIAAALDVVRQARHEEGLADHLDARVAQALLDPAMVARYREVLALHPVAREATTHISVLDGEGNAASLTASNGEGSGWVMPGTGAMLNNMLGEADLQPLGFGRWPLDTRLTSMMAPTVVEERGGGGVVVLGSGGSNRIRSAILQVLLGLLELGLPLAEAVARPRLHVEGSRLEIEGGFEREVVDALTSRWADHRVWPGANLFFGGAHAVRLSPGGWSGAGDPRRGGVAWVGSAGG